MFRKVTDSINGLRLELAAIHKALSFASDALKVGGLTPEEASRLSALEGRLEAIMGQVDAGITREEALKGAARASEERARGHMKRAERLAESAKPPEGSEDEDSFVTAGRAYQDLLAEGNGEDDEVLPTMSRGLGGRRARLSRVRAKKRAR